MSEKKNNNALLFIEDNPLLLHAYKRGFEEKNIEVHVAYDGDIGLQIARDKKPSVILLDLTVHGMDGLRVLEEIKNSEETKDIDVVVFTMSEKPEDKEQAMEKGANEYLIKSDYSLDDVIEIVLKYFPNRVES